MKSVKPANALEEIFGEEYLRKLGIYIINGKKYYAPWYFQYLSQGHYRMPNGEFYRKER
tara:strand:- start:31 stop:207 length:177 start_codon:yes stop_codon:yes gene_type:complete